MENRDIAEVAVIGVDHATLGQEVAAYVVLHEGATLSEDDVRAFAGETLAAYKVPTHVVFVDALPHNAAGKVMKHVIGKESGSKDFIEE
jgi:acyl-CoA synthetase (AMP-forming)/AMP-acid ligase II